MPLTLFPVLRRRSQNSKRGESSFLDDVCASDDTEKPISGGIFVYNKSEKPHEYTYTYDELKIMLEGSMTLTDKATGETLLVKAGDVVKIPNFVQFPDTGKAFYVGQRGFRTF